MNEQFEVGYALKQIVQADVRLFFYLERRERTLDSPIEKAMLTLQTMADEMEREKARQRTYDAMLRRAQAGHVTGGKLFGYDNVEIMAPDGTRSHVERRINDGEADVIRRIFDLCAAGYGYTRIAKLLNGDGAVCPRPQRQRPTGWAPSSVNEVLHRETYRGNVVWNRTRKRNRWGQHRQAARPEAEWLRHSVPALRIVSDAQWAAAHDRLSGIRAHLLTATGGRGRRRRDVDSHYLLPGFARCGVCGGGLCVMSRDSGASRRFVYGCMANHKRGRTICDNGLVVSMEHVDRAVLGTLGTEVLRPALVDAMIAGVLEAMEPRGRAHEAKGHRAALVSLEGELGRLTDAIAAGGPIASLVTAVQERQAEREDLLAALAASEATARLRVDRQKVERHVRAKLADWRGLLSDHVQDGRTLLRTVLTGPIRFRPEGKAYRFEGNAALDQLLAGVVATNVASPPGFEPGFQP